MRSLLKKFFTRDNKYLFPSLLFLIGIAAYGILLSRPGFYWDDWESVYLAALHDPLYGLTFFGSRPLSALIYMLFFPITKTTPLEWLLIGFALRWVGILGIYYALKGVWPERLYLTQWVCVFLFVYPAFIQQAVAICYSRHFTSFALFGLSLYFTIRAITDRKYFWVWMPLSVLSGLAQIYMIEYFVGLEILRPLLIWFTLQRREKPEKKSITLQTFYLWSPFIVGLLIYSIWKFAYLPTVAGGDPNSPKLLISLLQHPFRVSSSLVRYVLQDARFIFWRVWADGLSAEHLNFLHSKIDIIAWCLGIITALIAVMTLQRTKTENQASKNKVFTQMIFFGLAAFLGGGIPVWATNRQLALNTIWSDRFSLASLMGASIIVVYFIDWLVRTHFQKQLLLSSLLALSISLQVINANDFRQDWVLQRNIYWQLAWRIPSLEPGTAVIGKGTFTPKSSYYDGIYIVNLLFDKQVDRNPEYGYFDIYHLTPSDITCNQPLSEDIKGNERFTGNTSKAIGMYFNWEGGCVRLLDPIYAGDPNYADNLNDVVAISNLNLVMPSDAPTEPDPAIFGTAPPHDWCYYFEKADFARQVQDWKTVLEVGSEIEAQGLKPKMGLEYLPFIEAAVQTGDWLNAYNLSLSANTISPGVEKNLCDNWTRFAKTTIGKNREEYLAKALSEFCNNR